METHRWTRAVGDQSAPIPRERTSELGEMEGAARCPFCSQNAHDKLCSRGLLARLGVPVCGRVRQLRELEGQPGCLCWRTFSASCYDTDPMNTRSESGKTNLVAIAILLGVVIAGVWIWKRLSLDTQEYVIDQAIPVAFVGLVIAAGLFLLLRALNRRRTRWRERARLLAAFEQATVQEKKLEIAFELIDVNGYRSEGLESVTPALRDLFSTTLQFAVGDKQHRIRGMAASHLGVLNDRTVIPLLMNALEDEHAYVRSCAALGLGRLRASEAREKLTIVMEKDWDQTVRSRSKEALERIKQS
jgi:hypothetical protein